MPNVRFRGDPVPGETGQPGAQPKIPLNAPVQGVTEELLNREESEAEQPKDFKPKSGKASTVVDDDDDIKSDDDQEGPGYERNRLGAQIGLPPEEAIKAEAVEKELDKQSVVPCIFKRQVKLNHEGLVHIWQPGVHLVPISLAGVKGTADPRKRMHWWLRDNGVKRTGAAQTNPRTVADDESDDAEDAAA